MNKHTETQLMRFMGILKALGLTKEEILGICSTLKTENMMIEMVNRMEAKNFKLTPRETMNICGQVIKENRCLKGRGELKG